MKRKILLFGFEDLSGIFSIQKAMAETGVEVVSVGRGDYGKTIGVLAGLDSPKVAHAKDTALGFVGQMVVLCVPMNEVQALLPVLNQAGAAGCLKAVLTPNNRNWTPVMLYYELAREHQELRGK